MLDDRFHHDEHPNALQSRADEWRLQSVNPSVHPIHNRRFTSAFACSSNPDARSVQFGITRVLLSTATFKVDQRCAHHEAEFDVYQHFHLCAASRITFKFP
jgi:hypothetical protein